MHVRSLSVAMTATALALAGCGGGSSSTATTTKTDPAATFKSEYQNLVGQLANTTMAVGRAVQSAASQNDAQLESEFKVLADQWQTELSKLQTLKAPAKMAADLNTLTGAATRVESDLNAIVSAAATHAKQPAEQASATLVNDALATKNAATKLNQELGIK